jgi:hypothetical protein
MMSNQPAQPTSRSASSRGRGTRSQSFVPRFRGTNATPKLMEFGRVNIPQEWKKIHGFYGISIETNIDGQVMKRFILTHASEAPILVGSPEFDTLLLGVERDEKDTIILSRAAKIRSQTHIRFVLRKSSLKEDLDALDANLKTALAGTNDQYRAFLHQAVSQPSESKEVDEIHPSSSTTAAIATQSMSGSQSNEQDSRRHVVSTEVKGGNAPPTRSTGNSPVDMAAFQAMLEAMLKPITKRLSALEHPPSDKEEDEEQEEPDPHEAGME